VILRSLESETFEAIHAAFAEAFSDYIVRLSPTLDGLREMLTRRGWVPELSVGVYDGEQLVAFTLNGLDGTTGYDSGTGVIPSHRRAGLARQTMEWSRTRLRDAGATRYVLEVLEANTPAAALYRDCGFDVTRRLQCWTYESDSDSGKVRTAAQRTITPEWCDVEPAWQNTTASLHRARDPYELLGDADSYAVVFPSNGDLAQLAVDPAHRRKGHGRSLLAAAHTLAGKPLRIMNVDTRDDGITAFLDACGAKRMIAQLEMACSLVQ